ncbi:MULTISPECIES: hypothetical protein [Rhodococcus]|uniref:Amidohydrolase 3 domain-containing protein n=1 Tax=Rhodococcus jostii TaxID=132919 RepID=A0ABU4CEH0_RHOJO|nr:MULTISPECIES: hypothetical protein [Rhodococcus]MDI9949093.1 hypothetical protein [Rhodococcus sp. IEGM 1305]MDI9978551.1 hypothetical protein [Rhodococcus sp. IEGM 1307]MDV6281960.1 hypothetical protein [Rhodococcus jostii]
MVARVLPGAPQVVPVSAARERTASTRVPTTCRRASSSAPSGSRAFAWLLAWALDARLDEDLEACFGLAADGGAAAMGLPRADLQPGSPADFMLLDGECVPQIVVDVPRRDTVVRAGGVVARDGRLL